MKHQIKKKAETGKQLQPQPRTQALFCDEPQNDDDPTSYGFAPSDDVGFPSPTLYWYFQDCTVRTKHLLLKIEFTLHFEPVKDIC